MQDEHAVIAGVADVGAVAADVKPGGVLQLACAKLRGVDAVAHLKGRRAGHGIAFQIVAEGIALLLAQSKRGQRKQTEQQRQRNERIDHTFHALTSILQAGAGHGLHDLPLRHDKGHNGNDHHDDRDG